MITAQELIAHFHLQPHPKEGGYFRESYRAAHSLPAAALPVEYGSPRSTSTAIYYLLKPGTFSALHRLRSDEIFHFYLGDPVRMLQLSPSGQGRTVVLGPRVLEGQQVQVVVPAGTWQGSFLEPGGEYALLGCTVAPGCDYYDYEEGTRDLAQSYPDFDGLIEALTLR